jgi:hypothetical protein
MKPQLIEAGYHNADLPKSTLRIIQGGSWKKQRTVMLIPAGPTIPTKVYLSHCALIFPPNQAAHRMAAIGMEVGGAFSDSIAEILANPEVGQWEYLLTIEHDNVPPQDGLVKLIKRMEDHPEFACIGGLYWTKGIENAVPQIWGDPKDPLVNFRPQPPDPNGGLVECCGTGMGFNLWRLQMFRDPRLRRPWFKTLNGSEGQGVGTQDLYFWGDARKYGYRCAIDCSVKVGHYDLEGRFGQPDMMY